MWECREPGLIGAGRGVHSRPPSVPSPTPSPCSPSPGRGQPERLSRAWGAFIIHELLPAGAGPESLRPLRAEGRGSR